MYSYVAYSSNFRLGMLPRTFDEASTCQALRVQMASNLFIVSGIVLLFGKLTSWNIQHT